MRSVRTWVTLAFAVACLQSLTLAGNQESAEQVAAYLGKNDQLRNYRVGVRFQGGTATLKGVMSSQQQIDLAVRIAGEVPGVRQVVSELTVAPDKTKPAQAIFAGFPKTGPGASPRKSPDMNDKGTIKVAFLGPPGATVVRSTKKPDVFDSKPVTCPTICTLSDGATYHLKINSLPNRPGIELFPTLEIKSVTPRTKTLLTTNAIPVSFEKDAIAQVVAGKAVTNAIYLPDTQSQWMGSVGIETLTNSRMAPEKDPIAEADRRGTILAIVQIKRTALPRDKAR